MALILLYGLGLMCWALLRGALTPEEAKTIFMGRHLLARGMPPCFLGPAALGPSDSLDGLMCAYPGSVALAPVAVALADSLAGLSGARLAGAIQGLALVVLVHGIGNTPLHGRRGVLAAATFASLGLPLQLAAAAHARVYAALLVALSLFLIERSALPETRRRELMLLLAALSCSLAAMTSYVAALFAGPLVLLAFLRHRFMAASRLFLLPVLVALSLYVYFAVFPAWPALREALERSWSGGWTALSSRMGEVFNWLAMPYLLATFGMFQREGGKGARIMAALSACSFLAPVMSSRVDAVHTAVLVALVFLAPAAGLGVAQMGDLFSSGNPMARARAFFVGSVLVVVWVFGLQEMKNLRRSEPDLSAAVVFLRDLGPSATTVLVDSDHGSPEYVYRYSLEAARAPARVVSIARATEEERRRALESLRPDYVVLDDQHSDRSFARACREYLAEGYSIAASYPMTLVSGVGNLRVLRRKP